MGRPRTPVLYFLLHFLVRGSLYSWTLHKKYWMRKSCPALFYAKCNHIYLFALIRNLKISIFNSLAIVSYFFLKCWKRFFVDTWKGFFSIARFYMFLKRKKNISMKKNVSSITSGTGLKAETFSLFFSIHYIFSMNMGYCLA